MLVECADSDKMLFTLAGANRGAGKKLKELFCGSRTGSIDQSVHVVPDTVTPSSVQSAPQTTPPSSPQIPEKFPLPSSFLTAD